MKLGEVSNEAAEVFGKPLSGVRVLALEQLQALPWATQLLARLGADVVKIEHPRRGDLGRSSQPSIPDPEGRPLGATFLRNNLNKRSVCIDIKTEAGQSLIHQLAKHYDIVCENFKAGTLAALGLDYAALAKENEKLIYLSLSGFGSTRSSPYQAWPAYAAVAEAMSGVYEYSRAPNQPPVVNPVPGIGDTGSGLFAVVGLLAALRHRDMHGQGQHIDIAMLDAMLALGDYPVNAASMGLRRAPDEELAAPLISHGFRAQDGWFIVQIGREPDFEKLAHLIGCPEWLDDKRFATRMGWVEHLPTVIRPAIEAWAENKTKMQAAEALIQAGIAAAPCLHTDDLPGDAHVKSHGMYVEIPRPAGEGDPVLVAGNPIKMSKLVDGGDSRVPWLAEHTDEVLRADLGLDQQEIEDLRSQGVIA